LAKSFTAYSYGRSHCASHALAACFFMFILCHAAKNEPRKRAKGCRLWKLLPCRSSKRVREKDIKLLSASLAISQHERQAKTDEMRQSKSNIVERVGRGPRACGSYSVDKGENYPILPLAFSIKFLGIQGGFFQKAPLVAEGAFGPSYLIFCWLHQIFIISLWGRNLTSATCSLGYLPWIDTSLPFFMSRIACLTTPEASYI